MFLAPAVEPRFKFEPISHSWVAIHPNPKGVIQFIGGAFFGTFPTVFYRSVLQDLFEAGYTIVALPFRFTLRHWPIALSLLEEHYTIRRSLIDEITKQAKYRNYQYQIYFNSANYVWVGHSLGCKYIVMLEVLNDGLEAVARHANRCGIERSQLAPIQTALEQLSQQLQQLEQDVQTWTGESIDFGDPGIKDEASLLMAPAIADLDAAIPLRSLRHLLNRLGVQVLPTVEQTHQLMALSRSFNLTYLIQFQHDQVARATCDRFSTTLSPAQWVQLAGHHLTPLGIRKIISSRHSIADSPCAKSLLDLQDQRSLTSAILAGLQHLTLLDSLGSSLTTVTLRRVAKYSNQQTNNADIDKNIRHIKDRKSDQAKI